MRARHTLTPAYFAALYAADADPWRFASSDYEAAKYADTLAALPRPRYANAFEVGCSIGVFTRALAARCAHLLAVDLVEQPLSEARRRCADLPHVAFARRRVPAEWPDGRYDLIVLSEVLYYMTEADVVATAWKAAAAATGNVLLVHWLGETDYPLSGDAAVGAFLAAAPRLVRVTTQRRECYRLDLLTV